VGVAGSRAPFSCAGISEFLRGNLHPVSGLGKSYSCIVGWLLRFWLRVGGVAIAKVEEGHALAVGLGGYGLNDILLLEYPGDKGKVARIRVEPCQVLELEHIY